MKTMFRRSATARFSSSRGRSVLSMGADSPVRAASSALKLTDSTTLASAGTRSPASRSIRSPGTRLAASTSSERPSRRTRTVGTESFFSAAMARSARYSWVKPRMALRMTMIMIMIASSVAPTTKETTAATRRTTTITSVNWPSKTESGLRKPCSSMLLGP